MALSRPRGDLVWVITAAMAIADLVALTVLRDQPLLAPEPALPTSLGLLAVVVMFFVGERLVVNLYLRDTGHNLSLVELPIAVCLILATPFNFILGLAIGSFAALLPVALRARQFQKICFNTAMLTLAAVLTSGLHRWLLGEADPASLRGWVALAIAIMLGQAWISGMIVLVIKLTQPNVAWRDLLWGNVFSGAVTASLTLIGILLAVATRHEASLLWVDAAAMAGIYALLRAYGSMGLQHRTLGLSLIHI